MIGPEPPDPPWLDAWWALQRAQRKQERLEREAEDPGVPAWRTEAMGYSSPAPVSFVAAARHRIPDVFNLDKLHRRVYELMGVVPA